MSTAENAQLRWANILRGRTTIVASDIYSPLHCLHTVSFNKVTLNTRGPNALVIVRAITITEGYYAPNRMCDLMMTNSPAAGRRSSVASDQPAAALVTAPAATNAGAIAVFDPRGSRIIRV